MSAPRVVSVSPVANDTDVVLGAPILVTFDQPVNPKTVTNGTFVLYGPGETNLLGPTQLNKALPSPFMGRDFVKGRFYFPNEAQAAFQPLEPLKPNTKYTLLLAGNSKQTAATSIKNPGGESLADSFQIKFTTGAIDQTLVPTTAPGIVSDPAMAAYLKPQLLPDSIEVLPVALGEVNDLTQTIEIRFETDIDPSSFTLEDLLVTIDPLSNDPLVSVPANLQCAVEIQGPRLLITISGWPTDEVPPLLAPPQLPGGRSPFNRC
jgi:hypothetical protein